jgi:PAS domain S-box-containing protein
MAYRVNPGNGGLEPNLMQVRTRFPAFWASAFARQRLETERTPRISTSTDAVSSRWPDPTETTVNTTAEQPVKTAFREIKLEMNDEKTRGQAEADRGVIEAVRDPIAITGPDGKIIYANAAMEAATGMTRAEMNGVELVGLFTGPPEARAAQQRAFDGGFISDQPLELVHRDGRRTPVLCNLSVRRDAAGRPAGLILSARNLSALRRAEEELHRLNKELDHRVGERTARLEAANRELEVFAYSVAHDLRAPLRSINTFTQKLQAFHSQQMDAAGRATLENIARGAGRMGELIEDLLKLSSVTRHELSRARVDLSALAASVLADLQKAEPERRVRLMITPGLTAHADARMMKIVLENLMSNAWKFVSGQSAAEIEFGVFEGKGVRAFFVRDNGAGFNMESAQKLFGAFERLHAASDYPGTGVGLATVQRIIHRHGGRVWAESRVGRGAAFYFTLPEPELK